MEQKSPVQILLSTYNGGKFLEEQMDSILLQDYCNISILIRDDGSSDDTISILKNIQGETDYIDIIFGDNIGIVNSFFMLVQNSDANAQYFAFADQDDYWKTNKISRAIEMLSSIPCHIPALYCSDYTLVDDRLEPLPYKRNGIKIVPNYRNAMIENIATGCTIVINRAARNELLRTNTTNIIMHDWWMYLLVAATGQVIYDTNKSILYRQHGNNAIGIDNTFIKHTITRIKNLLLKRSRIGLKRQLLSFIDQYGDKLSPDCYSIIESFCERRSLVPRIRYIVSAQVYRQSRIDTLIFKVLFMLGHYERI